MGSISDSDSQRIVDIEKKWCKPISVLFYDWHWKDNLKHKEIAERISVPKSTVTRWFKQFKIPTQSCTRFTGLNLLNVGLVKGPRAKPKIKREFPWKCNREFFKTWSPEMSYILGFFTADGNMIKNNRGAHFIAFYSTDKDIIEKNRIALNSNLKISLKNKQPINSHWKDSYQLQVGSKEIFNDLLNLGMTPNKSLTIKMPMVPPELLSHFIRGYFDGDGHVTTCEYQKKDRKNKSRVILSGFTSGSREFLEGLRVVLKEHANIQGGTLHRGSRKANYYRFCLSVSDSQRLYNFMYKDDNNLNLNRKKSIFEHYFKIGRVV